MTKRRRGHILSRARSDLSTCHSVNDNAHINIKKIELAANGVVSGEKSTNN